MIRCVPSGILISGESDWWSSDNIPVRSVKTCCFYLTSPETGGWWNTKGCMVVSRHYGYTVCYCNHTTNFALLLQVYEAQVMVIMILGTLLIKWNVPLFICYMLCVYVYFFFLSKRSPENEKALQVLTFIGCGVSMCGLLFTFILFIAVGWVTNIAECTLKASRVKSISQIPATVASINEKAEHCAL